MAVDIQKASIWKRTAAWMFDGILVSVLAVGIGFLLSMLLGYDNYSETLDLAYAEYEELSPLEKHEMSGLQEVIAKGKPSEEYLGFLLSLVNTPDTYSAGFLIRERLVRSAPEKLRSYTFEFYNGVLLMDTLKEFARYGDAESENMLRRAKDITEEDVRRIHREQKYCMCVTMYEKCRSYCTAENIRYEAKRLLRKLEKKNKS